MANFTEDRIVHHEWNGNEETITDIGPLIRCNDCIYYSPGGKVGVCRIQKCGTWHKPNFFCAKALKKVGEK